MKRNQKQLITLEKTSWKTTVKVGGRNKWRKLGPHEEGYLKGTYTRRSMMTTKGTKVLFIDARKAP